MDEQPAWTLGRRTLIAGAGAATLAAAAPALAAIDAPPLGEWTDWDGLPAYRYTGPLTFDTLPKEVRARLPDDPWFLIGNHRLTLFVHASGRVRLLTGERGWAAMNGVDGRHRAGITIERGASFTLAGPSASHAPVPPTTRLFAPGAARFDHTMPGLSVTRALACPPSRTVGDGPAAFLVTLTLRNTGTAAIKIVYAETVTTDYRLLEAPWDDRSKRVRFDQHSESTPELAIVHTRITALQPLALPPPPSASEFDSDPPMLWAAQLTPGIGVVADGADLGASTYIDIDPGQTIVLRYAFGYARSHPEITAAHARLAAAPSGDAPFAAEWAAQLPTLGNEHDPQIRREARWNAATLEAMAIKRDYYDEVVVPQGTVYDYGWGWTGWTRDVAQHALPLARTNPPLARSVLRYILKRLAPDGESKPWDSGYGWVLSGSWQPSDMQLYLFLFAAQYLKHSSDATILSDPVAWHPAPLGATGTGLEHLTQAFHYARDRVGTGAHGLTRLWNSDWNDLFYFAPRPLPYAEMWGSAESHLNTALAIVALGRIAPQLAHLSAAARPLAEAMVAWRADLLAAFLRDLGDRAFPRRAYVGTAGAIGDTEMWLEPAAFALMIPELGMARRRAIADALFARLAAGEPLGPRQIERAGPMHDLQFGERENGGIWPALTGPAILGLLEFDPARARDLMARWSFANFARRHPGYWMGRWSASDSFDSARLPAGGTSVFPPFCAHAHAWPLHCYLESRA